MENMEYENNGLFWQKIDTLIMSSDIHIVSKKGNNHHKYPSLIYPLDYGFVCNDSSDKEELSCYVRDLEGTCNSIIIAADILSGDIRCKLLIGTSKHDEEEILRFLNQTDFQKTVILRRGNSVPSWATNE